MRTVSRTSHPTVTGRLPRRRFLAGTLLVTAAIGLSVTGIPTARAQKASKAVAQYQDQPNRGQRCSGCRYFQRPNGCQRVQGTISRDGWCAFWTGGGARGNGY